MPDDKATIDGWIITAEAAERLGVTQRYIRKLIDQGKLEGRKMSRNLWLVKENSLVAYQQARTQQG